MDNLTQEQRKKNMRAIRSKNTKMESIVCKKLWCHGIRFRKNVKDLPGKPDIAVKKYKIVIFLDSCFWHKCPLHFIRPQSNNSYWDKKIERNVCRDVEVNSFYQQNGWHILRIWEHQFKTKESQRITLDEITTFIENIMNKPSIKQKNI